jgi:hypothetical protein
MSVAKNVRNPGRRRGDEVADVQHAAPIVDRTKRQRDSPIDQREQPQHVALHLGAVHQRKAQHGSLDASGAGQLTERLFRLQLAPAVGIGRLRASVLRPRGAVLLSHRLYGTGEDEVARPDRDRLFGEHARGLHVGPAELGQRIHGGLAHHMHPSREVYHGVGTHQRGPHDPAIQRIADPHPLDAGHRMTSTLSGASSNRRAGVEERAAERPADKSG